MKKRLNDLIRKMNEPKLERVLIILLPCLAILISVLILLPRITALTKAAAPVKDELSFLPPLPTLTPSPAPTSSVTPEPAPIATLSPLVFAEPEKHRAYDEFMEKHGHEASGLYKLDGKLYYFDELHRQADRLGIDVSTYNQGIDWSAVRAQGIDFAILRVGARGWESGRIYNDDYFLYNLNEAKKAGIDIGVYFYSTAVNAAEALEEANYALEMLNGAELEYPIFIDIEQSGEYPNGRSDRLDKATRALVIDTFCTQIRRNGYRAGVYSGLYYFKSNLDYNHASHYTIWLAAYSRSNHLPYFNERYDMWQYTDSGIVYGIRSIVDMSVIIE